MVLSKLNKPKKDPAPLKMMHEHLVAVNNLADWSAVYRITCRSYVTEPMRKKSGLAASLTGFAYDVEADFQILRVAREWGVDAYGDRAMSRKVGHPEVWERYVADQQGEMSVMKAWLPVVFVCVRLAPPEEDMTERLNRMIQTSPRKQWRDVKTRLRIEGDGSMNVREVLERESVAREAVNACFDARPATTTEVQWLARRGFSRGLGDPVLDSPKHCPTHYERQTKQMSQWFSGVHVERHLQYLKCSSDLGDSYQAGLCVGEVGDSDEFTRACELMFSPLEEHRFPIDAALNVRWMSNEQAVRKGEKTKKRTFHQLAEEAAGEMGADADAYERRQRAKELKDRLRKTGEPLPWATLSMMLGATSLSELQGQVRRLQKKFPHPIHRPTGDQLEVFQQHLPGQRTLVRGFEYPFTCEQIGAMVPHATHEAGSNSDKGVFLARSLKGGHPILLDLEEASRCDRPPTIALMASLGGGKTMALQVVYYQGFLLDYRIVDIDPKGDHKFHTLPEVAPHADTIVLGPSPEHRGKLDPLRVAPADQRQDAATSFLVSVLPRPEGKEEAMIHGAVGKVLDLHGDRACCMAVIEELEGRPSEAEVGVAKMLREYCDHGIVQLGFARLGDPLPVESEKQVTYINVQALRTPGSLQVLRSEMTPAERHGAAMIQLVSLYAMKLMGSDRNRPKILGLDEAYTLASHAGGIQMLNQWLRWARSEFGIPILSTQNVQDLSKFQNLIGITLLGAMQSREDAEKALEAIGHAPDSPFIESLCSLYGRSETTKGQFLMKDLHERREEIQVMPGGYHVKALRTTPGDAPGDDPAESEPAPVASGSMFSTNGRH